MIYFKCVENAEEKKCEKKKGEWKKWQRVGKGGKKKTNSNESKDIMNLIVNMIKLLNRVL